MGVVNTDTIIGACVFPVLATSWAFYYRGIKKRIAKGYYDHATLGASMKVVGDKVVEVKK